VWGLGDLGGFDSILGRIGDVDRLDELERLFWLDLWRAPLLDAVDEEGIEVRRYGPVQAMVVAELPHSPLLNLVLGAAEPGAVQGGHLREAIEWAESLGIDCRVPVAPEGAEALAADDLLNRRGYQRGESLVRFVRDTAQPAFPEPAEIAVDELPDFTEGFSDHVVEGLGIAPMSYCLFDCLPGREMWRCYVALDVDERPIGAATMMVHGGVAQLAFAATRERGREKGAHLALLRRRIVDAAAAGCRTLFADTEELPGDLDGPSPAARNLVRAGFKQVAVRPVWRPLAADDR
jgi:hypothetical protein